MTRAKVVNPSSPRLDPNPFFFFSHFEKASSRPREKVISLRCGHAAGIKLDSSRSPSHHQHHAPPSRDYLREGLELFWGGSPGPYSLSLPFFCLPFRTLSHLFDLPVFTSALPFWNDPVCRGTKKIPPLCPLSSLPTSTGSSNSI